jgi:hypothetical protein
LGVTRQAVWKWRRAPGFAAEVRRVHERLVATAAERRVRAPGSR